MARDEPMKYVTKLGTTLVLREVKIDQSTTTALSTSPSSSSLNGAPDLEAHLPANSYPTPRNACAARDLERPGGI